MRQAGILAAAGIYALDHHVTRLKDDHRRAKKIGEVISKSGYTDWIMPVDTNIIIFRLKDELPASEFARQLKEKEILAIPIGNNQVRMVTHLDFDDTMLDKVIAALEQIKM